MFISKKDLDNLKEELRAEFEEKLNTKVLEINEALKTEIENWSIKARQKTKKVVD